MALIFLAIVFVINMSLRSTFGERSNPGFSDRHTLLAMTSFLIADAEKGF